MPRGNRCSWQDEQAARMGLGTAIMGCKEDDKVKAKDLIEVLQVKKIKAVRIVKSPCFFPAPLGTAVRR